MKTWIAALCLAVAPALAAQEPADSARAKRLRTEIEQRFAERVKADLALTDEQATMLRATQERFGERRRALMLEQAQARRALQTQMRPGVAADADSVRTLMERMRAGRAALLRLEEDEDREMAGYLTPVQRAQFQMMRLRFMERVQEVRRELRDRGQRGDRPGVRPRPEGRRPGRRPA